VNPKSTDVIVTSVTPDEESSSDLTRRLFFKRSAVIGATSLIAAGGLTTLASAVTKPAAKFAGTAQPGSGLAVKDRIILVAAQIAEAVAVTTYSNIINTAPFFTRIPSDDHPRVKIPTLASNRWLEAGS